MKTGRIALILIIAGIVLFIINALDVLLGYYQTHGKDFRSRGCV